MALYYIICCESTNIKSCCIKCNKYMAYSLKRSLVHYIYEPRNILIIYLIYIYNKI